MQNIDNKHGKRTSKKKLIITFLIAITLISVGIWYFFIDVQYEQSVNVKITNYGFWNKENISFSSWEENKTKRENITKENKSFLFINSVMHVDEHLVKGIDLLYFPGAGDFFRWYKIDDKNKSIYFYGMAVGMIPEELNNSEVNNSLKVVFGETVRHRLRIYSDSGGWLYGYYKIPYNISEIGIYDDKENLYKNISIKIDENYNVSIEGKKLNINETMEFTYLFKYNVYLYPGQLLCFAILILPIIIPSLLILKFILKKYYKN